MLIEKCGRSMEVCGERMLTDDAIIFQRIPYRGKKVWKICYVVTECGRGCNNKKKFETWGRSMGKISLRRCQAQTCHWDVKDGQIKQHAQKLYGACIIVTFLSWIYVYHQPNGRMLTLF